MDKCRETVMGKYIWLVETIFIAMMYVGCGNVTNLKNDIESNALLEDKQQINTQIINSQDLTHDIEDTKFQQETESWDNIVENNSSEILVQQIENELNVKDADLSHWFMDYNGETMQIISLNNLENEATGPVQRHEIVYYQTSESDIQTVVKSMIDAILLPLMEDSENRSYTIIKYELLEQPLIQIKENVWLLKNIHGYYRFEGIDVVSMNEAMKFETNPKDEMVHFFTQGSESVFYYILLKDECVYRLQRAEDML